jgi:cell division septation protein DedD
MTYEFSRKRLAALACCLILLVVFSFSAGLVAGIGLWMPTREELAILRHKPGEETAHVSPRPVQPAPPVQPPPTRPAEPAANSSPQPEAAAPVQSLAAPQPEQPSHELASTAEGDLFALQVGSFLDPKNARQLQSDLKDRGYNASVITALDADQREWHVVRMGSYKTLESAGQAAADFSGKERINALVRRANAL